jgi:hypothetical protein
MRGAFFRSCCGALSVAGLLFLSQAVSCAKAITEVEVVPDSDAGIEGGTEGGDVGVAGSVHDGAAGHAGTGGSAAGSAGAAAGQGGAAGKAGGGGASGSAGKAGSAGSAGKAGSGGSAGGSGACTGKCKECDFLMSPQSSLACLGCIASGLVCGTEAAALDTACPSDWSNTCSTKCSMDTTCNCGCYFSLSSACTTAQGAYYDCLVSLTGCGVACGTPP